MLHKIKHFINNLRILIAIFTSYTINSCTPLCTCGVDSSNWSFPITMINKDYHPTKKVTYVTCLKHAITRLYSWGTLNKKTGLWEFSGVLTPGEEADVVKELALEEPNTVISEFINN